MRQSSTTSTRGKKKAAAGKSASSRGGAQHRTGGRPSGSGKSQGPSGRNASGAGRSSSGSGGKSSGSGRNTSSAGRSTSGSGSSARSSNSGTRSASADRGRGDHMNDSGGRGNMRGNSSSPSAKRNRTGMPTATSQTHEGNSQDMGYLEKFFLDQLRDIYYAEHKITQSLPRMIDAATTDELSEAFDDHLHQTQRHIKRLEKVFETIGQTAEAKKCEAIEGIAREVDQIIEETEDGSLTRDAALIIAAQKVEHYEIATYGGLVQLAITMQLHDAAELLDKTLMEEEDTDALLTEIAEYDINLQAENEGGEYSWNTTVIFTTEEGEEEEEGEMSEEAEEESDGNEQADGSLM